VRCSAECPVVPAIGDGRATYNRKPRPNANNATITTRPSRVKEEKKRRLLSWSRDPDSQKGREVGSLLRLEMMQSQNQRRNDVDCGLFVQPSRVPLAAARRAGAQAARVPVYYVRPTRPGVLLVIYQAQTGVLASRRSDQPCPRSLPSKLLAVGLRFWTPLSLSYIKGPLELGCNILGSPRAAAQMISEITQIMTSGLIPRLNDHWLNVKMMPPRHIFWIRTSCQASTPHALVRTRPTSAPCCCRLLKQRKERFHGVER
jgi:hypothetical protein